MQCVLELHRRCEEADEVKMVTRNQLRIRYRGRADKASSQSYERCHAV